jgi:dipeptidase E
MTRKLLLISSSVVHGSGYLDHCEGAVRAHLAGAGSVVFVPYALANRDAYAARVRERLGRLGISVTSVHETKDPVAAVEGARALFIGGGNTFRLLTTLYEERLIEPIRRRALGGMPYMGSSAGTNMACPTIMTTNDMPIVMPPSFDALGLVPFQINPHYLDPDPTSKHQGETREDRIREFHEMNATPVAGLREGAMIEVDGKTGTLRGTTGMRLFRRGEAPLELAPGASLDFLV